MTLQQNRKTLQSPERKQNHNPDLEQDLDHRSSCVEKDA